jgi:O-acetyl-ADP-ribose deacetylase (regulator of RNase III)
MPVNVTTGDLFESEAQTLVNTVNCVGVMGKGVALGFKKRFPDMYEDYVLRCERGEVHLGRPYVFRRLIPPWILNFPTKDHWRSVARLSDIVAGLEYLAGHFRAWEVESLAVPPLGCGEGQLEWRVVGPTLYRHLQRLDIPVTLYAPWNTPGDQVDADFLAGDRPEPIGGPPVRVKPGEVALVSILERISQERYHAPIGRTAWQKLAYFATETGIPTGLEFERGSYGPFSSQLKPLLTRLVNNGLVVERRTGQMFMVEPGPTWTDARQRFASELRPWASGIERLTDLFLRIDTKDAEVLASAHYAATYPTHIAAHRGEREPSEADVVAEVERWKLRRRPPLSKEEISEAVRALNLLGWLKLEPSPDLPIVDLATV